MTFYERVLTNKNMSSFNQASESEASAAEEADHAEEED